MADKKQADGSESDPMAALRDLRDIYLSAWAKTMTETVNSEAYAKTTGAMLDTYLTASAPIREAAEKAMLHTLQQLGMPSRLDFVGLAERAGELARNLPYGHQRLVEIARALAGEPHLLLLDEPGAGMNPAEKGELVALIRRLHERGLTVLLVEHDMSLVTEVAQTITVLNFGAKIAAGRPEDIMANKDVIDAYLGSEASEAVAR